MSNIVVLPQYKPLYKRSPNIRYYALHGGRGSSKSFANAQFIIYACMVGKERVLSTRMFQSSIRESIYKLLVDTIFRYGVEDYWDIQQRTLIYKPNGSEIIFAGLSHNITEIKSMEGITICTIEEAQAVTHEMWNVLIPTIRESGSIFTIIWNPKDVRDPAWEKFIIPRRDDVEKIFINYLDNPFLASETVAEAEYMRDNDVDMYKWIWLGQPLDFSSEYIMLDKLEIGTIDLATPEYCDNITGQVNYTTYYGMDFGFSQDPTSIIRCNMLEDGVLYIDKEVGGVGIEFNDIGDLVRRTFPELGRGRLWADASQPGLISLIKKSGGVQGVEGAKKWSGSIMDGIGVIRNFKRIVVQSDCKEMIHEFQNYRWKVDKTTGDITNVPADKDNHYFDALRYALGKYVEKTVGRNKSPFNFK